jgi:hypothetical protein
VTFSSKENSGRASEVARSSGVGVGASGNVVKVKMEAQAAGGVKEDRKR